MAFATAAELAARLGLTFEAADTTRATALIGDIEAEIQSVCTRDDFTETEADEVDLRGNWTPRLYLPKGPIASVASAVISNTTLNASSYRIVGRSLVRAEALESTFGDPVIRGLHWGGPDRVVTVTYTHGWSSVPTDVKSVTLRAAARAWANPEGRKSVTLSGTYRVDFPDVELIYLTKGDLKVLRKYMLTEQNAA